MTLLQSTRPSFLVLSPVCVFLGASTAMAAHGSVDAGVLALIFIGAICAHISVNTLNEYADFRSGLDLVTVKTPFSGGSGALPRDPAMAGKVLSMGLLSLGLTFAIGIYFVNSNGALIVPFGIAGIIIILTYTKWINRWPFICLLAPGMGFGIIMVVGTHAVLTQHSTITAWLAALVPFFLVNNLLLLNQFPDIDADRSIGRNHLPIAFGTRTSSHVYAALSAGTYLAILAGVYYGYFPVLSLVALLPALLSLFALTGAYRYGRNIGAHHQYLAANVAATLLTPLLLGIAIIYG
mgnify:CR=1 FL=1